MRLLLVAASALLTLVPASLPTAAVAQVAPNYARMNHCGNQSWSYSVCSAARQSHQRAGYRVTTIIRCPNDATFCNPGYFYKYWR